MSESVRRSSPIAGVKQGHRHRRLHRHKVVKAELAAVALLLFSLLLWSLAGGVSGAEAVSALRVQVAQAPQWVKGSDGRVYLEYDLIVTNAFTASATLTSLEVMSGGKQLLSLSSSQLGASTFRLGTFAPTDAVVEPSSTVTVQVNITLPFSANFVPPKSLTNKVVYTVPADAPLRPILGTTMVTVPAVRVDTTPPLVIVSPLRGTGWLNGNGCCSLSTANHRQFVAATSLGTYLQPEVFAIDWLREVHGSLFTGNGSKVGEWPTFGAPVYAVRSGTIVSTIDGKPDIPPQSKNPDLHGPEDFSGNSVIVKIGPHRYACYAHLERDSVRVRAGEHVQAGQVIGRVGNSGNTTDPHLHFGIQSGPSCLSMSEPFEIDRYRLEGTVDPDTTGSTLIVKGPSHVEKRSLPLVASVAALSAARNSGT